MLREQKNERLELRYGKEITNDFISTINNVDITLTALAHKYRFSPEYARQVFEQVNGFNYTKLKQTKGRIRIGQNEANRIDPDRKLLRVNKNSSIYKGTVAEVALYDICKKLNIKVTPLFKKVDYLLNDRMVEMKSSNSCYKTSNKTNRSFYHFGRISDNEWNGLEFLVCLIVPLSEFYVIPKRELRNQHGIFIPNPENNIKKINYKDSRFIKYKNAWHLLL